jgi:tRNA(fMet)-specific endonuclease VapC
MIADTDFFIDIMRSKRQHHDVAVRKLEELDAGGIKISMAAITRFELSSGIEQFVRPDEERARVRRLVRAYPTLPLEGATADRSGEIYGFLRARGTTIGVADALIGATALVYGESVLTRNRKHFSRIQGLQIETY